MQTRNKNIDGSPDCDKSDFRVIEIIFQLRHSRSEQSVRSQKQRHRQRQLENLININLFWLQSNILRLVAQWKLPGLRTTRGKKRWKSVQETYCEQTRERHREFTSHTQKARKWVSEMCTETWRKCFYCFIPKKEENQFFPLSPACFLDERRKHFKTLLSRPYGEKKVETLK